MPTASLLSNDHQDAIVAAAHAAARKSLVVMPTLIDAPGAYITRCGERVEVKVASPRSKFECAGFYANGVRESWHRSGRLYFGQECANDIVSKAPAAEQVD